MPFAYLEAEAASSLSCCSIPFARLGKTSVLLEEASLLTLLPPFTTGDSDMQRRIDIASCSCK
jgi:hypothetical protein